MEPPLDPVLSNASFRDKELYGERERRSKKKKREEKKRKEKKEESRSSIPLERRPVCVAAVASLAI